jgi:hypothetical protein
LARHGFENHPWKESWSWTAKELREHIALGGDDLRVTGWKFELEGWEVEEFMRVKDEELKRKCEELVASRKAKREANKIKKRQFTARYLKSFH